SSVETMSECVKLVTYDDFLDTVGEAHTLLLYDLPPQLNRLEQIVKATNPVNIHVCFHVENSTYLSAFPSRKDFKWLYAMLYKRGKLHINNELRSEEHTSELQSRFDLVCRLLLEKKNITDIDKFTYIST